MALSHDETDRGSFLSFGLNMFMRPIILGGLFLAGCTSVDLDRRKTDTILETELGPSSKLLMYARCSYSVSELGAPSASFKPNGICALTENGITFLTYDKTTSRREFHFQVARSDIKKVSLWAKHRLRQVQIMTPVAQVVFDVHPDTGNLGDPVMGDAFWQDIVSQGYPASIAERGIFDEEGRAQVIPLIIK